MADLKKKLERRKKRTRGNTLSDIFETPLPVHYGQDTRLDTPELKEEEKKKVYPGKLPEAETLKQSFLEKPEEPKKEAEEEEEPKEEPKEVLPDLVGEKTPVSNYLKMQQKLINQEYARLRKLPEEEIEEVTKSPRHKFLEEKLGETEKLLGDIDDSSIEKKQITDLRKRYVAAVKGTKERTKWLAFAEVMGKALVNLIGAKRAKAKGLPPAALRVRNINWDKKAYKMRLSGKYLYVYEGGKASPGYTIINKASIEKIILFIEVVQFSKG